MNISPSRLTAYEALSRPFRYELECYPDEVLELAALVGKPYTVHLPMPDGSTRPLNGVVFRAEQGPSTVRSTRYTLELRPWFLRLDQERTCAVFQGMSVPDIVAKVCNDAGFGNIRKALSADYPAKEYTVRYGETSFAFLSRLMAEAGIFYFFEHDESSHTLVMADSPDAFSDCTQGATLEWLPAAPEGELPATPSAHVFDLSLSQQLAAASCFSLRGRSACSGLTAGAAFTVKGHPEAQANARWLTTEVRFTVSFPGKGAADSASFLADFAAVPAAVGYCPSLPCTRASMRGPLTGLVIGNEGEEICTDQYGRCKVRFHWQAESDENASCWLPVAQSWTGNGYGTLFLPRVGQEVIISFIGDDPDRPLVTGMVYNFANLSEHDLLNLEKGHRSAEIKGDDSLKVAGKRMLETKGDEERKCDGKVTINVKGDYTLKVSGNLSLEAGGTLKLKSNKAVAIESGGDINANASADMALSSKREFSAKGLMVNVKASGKSEIDGGGLLVVKGAFVRIN